MAEAATKLPVKTEKSAKPASKPAGTGVWHPFEALHQEIDRLFDDFSFGWPRLSFPRLPTTAPFFQGEFELKVASEVTEDDKAYRIAVELPGMEEKDVEVSVSDSALTIKGEKKSEKEETKKDYHYSERSYGVFRRSFALPEGVDADKIEASMKSGVLAVVLPKSAEAQKKSRKVEIKSA
jgi:HSP20 family protein